MGWDNLCPSPFEMIEGNENAKDIIPSRRGKISRAEGQGNRVRSKVSRARCRKSFASQRGAIGPGAGGNAIRGDVLFPISNRGFPPQFVNSVNAFNIFGFHDDWRVSWVECFQFQLLACSDPSPDFECCASILKTDECGFP